MKVIRTIHRAYQNQMIISSTHCQGICFQYTTNNTNERFEAHPSNTFIMQLWSNFLIHLSKHIIKVSMHKPTHSTLCWLYNMLKCTPTCINLPR